MHAIRRMPIPCSCHDSASKRHIVHRPHSRTHVCARCSECSGRFTSDGNTLTVGPRLACTRAACEKASYPNAVARLLRDAVVLPVLRSAWVQRRMFGKLSQLHVHYRRSSLSWDRQRIGPRGRLRAGDRAPGVAFADLAGGSRATLFELMAALRPLVLFSGVDIPEFREHLGTEPGWN